MTGIEFWWYAAHRQAGLRADAEWFAMNPEWLCYVNGQEYGPYTWPQLVQMAQAGNVVPQTHVRRNFDSQWYLAEQVPNLFSAPAARPNPKQAAHPAAPPRTPATISISKSAALSKNGMQPATTAAAPQLPPSAAMPQEPAYAQQPYAPAEAPIMPPQQPAVPKGRVVSAPTAAAAAADTKPKWIPVNPTPAAQPAAAAAPSFAVAPAASSEAAAIPGKKKDNSKQLVLYCGGAIAGVALLGCAALIWKFTRPPEKPAEDLAAAPVVVPLEESDPNVISEESNGAETNPTGVIETKPAVGKTTNTATTNTATAKPAAKTDTTPKKTDAAAGGATNAAALLKTVTAWKPIEKFGSIGSTAGLKCMKLECFLAADAAGRRVAWRQGAAAPATSPAAGEAPADGEAAPADAAQPAVVQYVPAEPAPFLFVTATITNTDKKARTYEGWNVSKSAAVAVDAQGNPLSLVPASQTPGVLRQPTKELLPNETIVDTLVFAVPEKADKADLFFRLALPKMAFASQFSGAWAYEIDRTDLVAAQETAAAPGQPGAAPAGTPPAQARSSTTIPIPGLHDVPPPMPIQPAPVQPAPAPATDPEMEKKPMPTERIPIPGLTDTPENKPAGPKKPDEVPNLNPPAKKK